MAEDAPSATVLLVEDDDSTVKIVSRTLEKSFPDVDIVVASDGRDGVEKAREARPDIVVLDWMMPEFGGDYFLEEQARDEAIAAIPVLIHTVTDKSQTSEAMSRYRAVKAFVRKLTPPVDLVEILRHFFLFRSGHGV